jgi:hypothetical protein
MKKRSIVFTISLVSILVWSCTHQVSPKDLKVAENRIMQQEDGSVSLKLDKAACYSDKVNPSNNTADWNIVISKPGRFKVWLSSATKDTTAISYVNSVRISLLDDNLLVDPKCDKIEHNSGDVTYPYYKTESYMGSVYVSEPGEYNIQVISEKVNAINGKDTKTSLSDDTMMLSVMLQPVQKTL